MRNQLFSISEAAKRLGISIDTLRRWDKAGRLKSIRTGIRGHRYYLQSDLDQFTYDIETQAREWIHAEETRALDPEVYCQNRDIFQARLENFQSKLSRIMPEEKAALVTAIAGEIGNNSFDHNLGNWPDMPGVFFAYSLRARKVVLADRGLGILTTLKRVKPHLATDEEALKVAFTETISGRYPEARGNGLKFVRSIVTKNPLALFFQTENAYLRLGHDEKSIHIQKSPEVMRGCFAIIGFEGLL